MKVPFFNFLVKEFISSWSHWSYGSSTYLSQPDPSSPQPRTWWKKSGAYALGNPSPSPHDSPRVGWSCVLSSFSEASVKVSPGTCYLLYSYKCEEHQAFCRIKIPLMCVIAQFTNHFQIYFLTMSTTRSWYAYFTKEEAEVWEQSDLPKDLHLVSPPWVLSRSMRPSLP